MQQLTLGEYFDQSLENTSLPSGLQQLTFGFSFNKCLGKSNGSSFPFRCSRDGEPDCAGEYWKIIAGRPHTIFSTIV